LVCQWVSEPLLEPLPPEPELPLLVVPRLEPLQQELELLLALVLVVALLLQVLAELSYLA
jgi:hypothetical protein